jgi:hypothetical protein
MSYEMIGKFRIELDKTYYLSYAGGKRELPQAQQREWNKTLQLPGELKLKEQYKIGLQNNPNVVPLRGVELMQFVKELKFIPFFDRNFDKTHLLQLTDLLVYESIKAKSYEMAMNK